MQPTIRRILLVISACTALLVLTGCVSPAGSRYRHHVNLTVAPVQDSDPALATAPPAGPAAIASVNSQ